MTSNPITVDLNTSPVAAFTIEPVHHPGGELRFQPAGSPTTRPTPTATRSPAAWTFPYEGPPGTAGGTSPPPVEAVEPTVGHVRPQRRGRRRVHLGQLHGRPDRDRLPEARPDRQQQDDHRSTGAPYPTGFYSPKPRVRAPGLARGMPGALHQLQLEHGPQRQPLPDRPRLRRLARVRRRPHQELLRPGGLLRRTPQQRPRLARLQRSDPLAATASPASGAHGPRSSTWSPDDTVDRPTRQAAFDCSIGAAVRA